MVTTGPAPGTQHIPEQGLGQAVGQGVAREVTVLLTVERTVAAAQEARRPADTGDLDLIHTIVTTVGAGVGLEVAVTTSPDGPGAGTGATGRTARTAEATGAILATAATVRAAGTADERASDPITVENLPPLPACLPTSGTIYCPPIHSSFVGDKLRQG